MIKLTNWHPKTKLEEDGIKIARLLKARGFQAFWVGGLVRNLLLKIDSDNLDITTDALPEQVEKILKKGWITTKAIGKKFGTIVAITKGLPIEITTFRAESRYSDFRHPDEVKFIRDYIKDAQRRDFRINALYFDPIEKIIFDPTGGLTDLKNKIIRFVGDPRKRIDEDPLRMLRAVRLLGQFGFSAKGACLPARQGPASPASPSDLPATAPARQADAGVAGGSKALQAGAGRAGWKMEKRSFAAIKIRAKLLTDVSGERIKMEFDKILKHENPVKIIKLLDQTGLLKFIFPELVVLKKMYHKSTRYHLEGSVFDHSLLAFEKVKNNDLDLKYAALLHDIGKNQVIGQKILFGETVNSYKGHEPKSADIFKSIADRLKFPKDAKNRIFWALSKHMDIWDFDKLSESSRIKLTFNPNFKFLIELGRCDETANIQLNKRPVVGWQLGLKYYRKYLKKKSLIEKLTKGKLLIKISKIPPGPKLGALIEEIKLKVFTGEIKNLGDLKIFLKKYQKST